MSRMGYNVYSTCTLASVAIVIVTYATHTPYALTTSDLWYQMFTTCMAFMYIIQRPLALLPEYTLHQGACIHALDTLCTLSYGTPENPFAAIIGGAVCIRTWSRLIACFGKHPSVHAVIDLACTAVHGCLICEFGILPQIRTQALWPVTFSTSLFLGYAWLRCSSSSSSSSG